MAKPPVVSNTSPLITLVGVGLLELLPVVYGNIWIDSVTTSQTAGLDSCCWLRSGCDDRSGLLNQRYTARSYASHCGRRCMLILCSLLRVLTKALLLSDKFLPGVDEKNPPGYDTLCGGVAGTPPVR